MPLVYRHAHDDGNWHHPTLPPVIGGDDPDPPVANPEMWFGVTLFGQSYGNYKNHKISNTGNRYRQVEFDTVYDGDRGGAATREFGSTNDIGEWSDMTHGFIRNDQPIIYSFKDGNNYDGKNETQFKQSIKDFIDSRPGGSNTRVWLAFAHEFDNDAAPSESNPSTFNGKLYNGVGMTRFYDRNLWIREVLDDAPYSDADCRNGGWLRFGVITTGSPFQGGMAYTNPRVWKAYHDQMATHAGRDDVWDFWGCDKYNPAWEGANRYMLWSDWSKKFKQCHEQTGLPIVIAEAGSPRADSFPSGWTTAQRNAERADWLAEQYGNMKAEGYYDVCTYWRVPANKEKLNAWSTNMVVPTGYNSTLTGYSYTNDQGVTFTWAGSGAQGNGGFDDQDTCDVISEFCITSIREANAISGNPTIPFYTGSGGFG